MLSTIWHAGRNACGIVRRHKKLVLAGSILVSAAGVYYGMRKVMAEAEKLAQEFEAQLAVEKELSEKQRKEIHLKRSKEECEAAVYRFLPTFRQRLYDALNMDDIINRVKTLSKNDRLERNRLWEELKVLGLARYLSGVYAFCLLHTLVHIQLHIIGRQSYECARSKTKQLTTEAEQEARREVLGSTIEYFLNEGLPMLIQYTKDAVDRDVGVPEWKVNEKTQVQQDDFFALLKRIHESIIPGTTDEKLANWRAFIMFSEKKGSPEMMAILNEIWSVLDTDSYQQLLHETLNCCFELICQDLSKGIFQQGVDTPPLAKVIPRMKYEINQLYSGKSNVVRKRYCRALAELDTLQGLCSNIFFKE